MKGGHVVLASLGLGALVGACRSPAAPQSPPVLSAPIVDLSTVRKFIPFGAELSPGRLNPAYELVVNGSNVDVRAATAGKVTRVEQNDQGDAEIHVESSSAKSYLVIYDHVRDVAVSVGTSVQAGTRLGRVGVWNAATPQGRVELQINHEDVSVCPKDLGTAEFNSAHDAALAAANPLEQQPGWTAVCLAATVVP